MGTRGDYAWLVGPRALLVNLKGHDRLLVLLARWIKQGNLRNGEAMTLAGKTNHYANLVNGKFECCLLIHLVQDDRSKDLLVKVGKQARVSMTWWVLNLRALTGRSIYSRTTRILSMFSHSVVPGCSWGGCAG